MPTPDLVSVLLGLGGLALAVGLAIIAGRVIARVFFDASRRVEDER